MARELENAPRRQVLRSATWAVDTPPEPGVYALWDIQSGAAVYVGETSSLRHRMRDLGRTVNHTCRRKIAARHQLTGANEVALSAAIAERYTPSFIQVSLGRVELEEYLSIRWGRSLFNSPARRLLRGRSYSWAEPA